MNLHIFRYYDFGRPSRPSVGPWPFRKPLAKDIGKTLTATKPWLAEGMSRATWYRLAAMAKKARQAEKKGK